VPDSRFMGCYESKTQPEESKRDEWKERAQTNDARRNAPGSPKKPILTEFRATYRFELLAMDLRNSAYDFRDPS
jgi:hypothetical protein